MSQCAIECFVSSITVKPSMMLFERIFKKETENPGPSFWSDGQDGGCVQNTVFWSI